MIENINYVGFCVYFRNKTRSYLALGIENPKDSSALHRILFVLPLLF